jgi:hypothetical protein
VVWMTRCPFIVMIDESGTDQRNRAAVVAGNIGQVRQWERLEKEWKNLIHGFDVSRMRRSDLEAAKGDITEWNDERRIRFLKRAHLLNQSIHQDPNR